MRLDHLLSKEEQVGVCFVIQPSHAGWQEHTGRGARSPERDDSGQPIGRSPTSRRSAAKLRWGMVWKCQDVDNKIFLVSMRLGDTPVPIPNTMVKTQAADGTILETVWESRRMPDPGGLAQLGERLPCKQEVTSSNLVISIE